MLKKFLSPGKALGNILLCAMFVFSMAMPAQSAEGIRPTNNKFNHEITNFKLTGIHTNTACESCHVNGIFKGTPKDCDQCHIQNNVRSAVAKPINHIPIDQQKCESCHTTLGWIPAKFDHKNIVGTCSRCHNNVNAEGKPAHHFPTTKDCVDCHSTTAWVPAGLDHSILVPPATGRCNDCHGVNATGKPPKHVRTTAQCDLCHKTTVSWLPAGYVHAPGDTNCSSCHNNTTVTGKNNGHINTSEQCSVCHTQVAWIPTSFAHTPAQMGARTCSQCHNGIGATGLKSTHIPVSTECDSCHTTLGWLPTSFDHSKVGITGVVGDNCTQCHNGTKAIGKPTKHVSTTNYPQCVSCHTTVAWKPTVFDHTGVTSSSNCAQCHDGVNATGKPTSGNMAHKVAPMTANTCGSCHKIGVSWLPATMNHSGAVACATCHIISSTGNLWTTGKMNHVSTTGFPQCGGCHTTTVWKPSTYNHHGVTTTTNCTTSCHNGSAATGRPTTGLNAHTLSPMTSQTCGSCHTIGTSWIPAKMNHTGVTNCTSCHTYSGNNWTPSKTTHIPTTTTQCSVCHTTTLWLPAKFNHTSYGVTSSTTCSQSGCHSNANAAPPQAGVPTSGTKAHALPPMTDPKCGACHTNFTTWTGAIMNHSGATNCTSCHSYSGNKWTITPAITHMTTASQCSNCHLTSAWKPASFAHDGVTASTDCTQSGCHNTANNVIPRAGVPTSGTKAHTTAPMTLNTCASCHNIGTTWTPATMNHSGATSCTSCHIISASGNLWTTAKSNHISTTGYAQCSSCHTTTAWKPTSFNHTGITTATDCTTCHNGTAASGRPVGTKAHTVAPMTLNTCGSCHTIGTGWTPTPMNHTLSGATSCTGCHIISASGNVWTTAKSNHISTTGYAQCSSCHTTTAWKPTSFNHTGMSVSTDCTTCHNGVSGTGRPPGAKAHITSPMTLNTCANCHTIGGAWTPTPMNHTLSGTTTCKNCHTYAGNIWTPAKATHAATLTQCSSCHVTTAWLPANFSHNGVTSATTCNSAGCHDTAGQATPRAGVSTLKPHTTAPMTSGTCASCHSIGGAWTPATMSHTGATNCNACHSYSANPYLWTTTNATPKPGHTVTSSQCGTCHLTTAWLPATFTHDSMTSATNCATAGCHNTPNAGSPKSGIPTTGTNAHTQAPMTNTTCADCHNIGTTWGPGTKMNHALSGAATCSNCHSYAGNNFTITPSATHMATTNQCSDCHTTTNWVSTFNHTSQGITASSNCAQSGCHSTVNKATPRAGVPTTGVKGHTKAPMTLNTCATCHGTGYASWTTWTMNHTGAATCSSCHTYSGNTWTPAKVNHITSSLGCDSCHTTTAWKPATFDHAANGVTSASNCTQSGCHSTANAVAPKAGVPTSGLKAHLVNPMTLTTCGSCHTSYTAWTPTVMNHTLSGASTCNNCHSYAGNNFTITPASTHFATTSQCSSCHTTTTWVTTFNHTTQGITSTSTCNSAGCHDTSARPSPRAGVSTAKPHTTLPMSNNTCGNCHTNFTAWTGAVMNHSGATSCSTCHNYSANPYLWTTLNAIPKAGHTVTATQCNSCHLTTAWLPATYSHNGVTSATNCTTSGCHITANAAVPIAGIPTSGTNAHTQVPMTNTTCGDCHNIGTTWGPGTKMKHTLSGATTCSNCHSISGNSFTVPTPVDHLVTASQCSTCHTTTNWISIFNHTSQSITLASNCVTSCHTSTRTSTPRQGAPSTGTKSHTTAPMTSQTCGTCHTNFTAWTGAKMNHTGATACATCHSYATNTSGWTVGSPYVAHPGTTGYPQCSSCHTTTAWTPSTFNHTTQLITLTSNCTTSGCHDTSGKTTPRAGVSTLKPHTTAPMTSTTCGTCHKNFTAWTGAVMTHTGATACATCHSYTANPYLWTTGSPYNLHPGTTGFPQCSSCHTTTAWNPSTFNHTTQLITLNAVTNCATAGCHNTSGKATPRAGVPTSRPHTTAPMNSTSCGLCHTSFAGWATWTMSHTGAVACSTCHSYTANPYSWTGNSPIATHPVTAVQCSNCHSTTSWVPSNFDHTVAGVTATSNCKTAGCHDTSNKATPRAGVPTLGTKIHTTAPMNVNTCGNCHSVGGAWTPATMNHTGATACKTCHNGTNYTGKTNTTIHTNTATSECSVCHTTTAWKPTSFTHTASQVGTNTCNQCHDGNGATGPTAAHPTGLTTTTTATHKCNACHTITSWTTPAFAHTSPSGVGSSCVTCHKPLFATDKSTTHFVTTKTCQTCHKSTTVWTYSYAHAGGDGYPSDHSSISPCTKCHVSNNEVITALPSLLKASGGSATYKPACAWCHAGQYQSSKHTKYPGVRYTVTELKDCTGACHVYTNSSLTTKSKTLNGPEHGINGIKQF